MKKIFLLLLAVSFFVFGYSQKSETQKIKIALIGTIHFEPSNVDMYKNKELNVFSERRQREMKEVIDSIASFNPDQICIEYPTSAQTKMDDQYKSYLAGEYKLTSNEIDQLGLQSAKALRLEKLTCVNYYGAFDSDTVMAYAQQNGQSEITMEFGAWAENFMKEVNENLEKKTIKDFLIYFNSKEKLTQNASLYSRYMTKIGKGDSYVGTDLVADWYSTNLHIYTNIQRQIKPTDKTILVIFGQGHIPILTHLFETNPEFEVVFVNELLGG